MPRLIAVLLFVASVLLFADRNAVAQTGLRPDNATCQPYRAKWNSVAGGANLTAMDGVLAIIPGICPNLKAEAQKRRADAAGAAPPPNPCAAADARWTGSLRASNDRASLQNFISATPGQCISRDAAQNRLASLAPPPTVRPAPVAPIVAAPTQPPRPASYSPGQTIKDCADCPELMVIPSGTFTMGSSSSEPSRDSDEGPQHSVRVQSFAAGKYEVTFDEWMACANAGGCSSYVPSDSAWGKGNRPVINVNWNDAKQYVQWLSGKTGKTYRLLTEGEWEYAARAGATTPFWWGSSITPDQANYDGTYAYNGGAKGLYRQKTMGVGSFQANSFGLYDVHGNVWEWVEDCYHDTYAGAPTDGSAWTSGDCSSRVLRGGSWIYGPQNLRSALRLGDTPTVRVNDFGFRVARTF